MEDKYFHVVMMDTYKESARYGKPIWVESFKQSETNKETIEQKIAEWENADTKPVFISDPVMIELFDFQRNNELSQESELHDMKSAIRNIADQLERLAW